MFRTKTDIDSVPFQIAQSPSQSEDLFKLLWALKTSVANFCGLLKLSSSKVEDV